MSAIDKLTQRLPHRLAALAALVMDLRWTWNHCGDTVWRAIDAEAWERTRNPYLILTGVSEQRLAQLAEDSAFLRLLDQLLAAHRAYRERASWWSAQSHPELRGVAYFSMEFGLSDVLPIYAGGLGVLAGDYLKTASDLGVPVSGVGLLFDQGYLRQRLDAEGGQQVLHPHNEPQNLPIEAVPGSEGTQLSVEIHLPGRTVLLRAWKAQVGRVSLYLLDSNHPWNSPADRAITDRLYSGDLEQRLLQEIALGVGGWRLIEALKLPIDLCHLNEGHAALAAVERACAVQRRERLNFDEALWATRAGNIFTTHTPVPSGFDIYPRDLVLKYGRGYALEAGIDEGALMGLGGAPQFSGGGFNMAVLAAHCCSTINGVSRRHGQTSRRIFAPLYPRWPLDQIPVTHVTNGVHMPSWDSAHADLLWSESCGVMRWLGDTAELEARVSALDDKALWSLKGDERLELVRWARQRLRLQLSQRNAPAVELDEADTVLDPNVLTLGFARRFTEYKRPNLILHDPERLTRLLLDAHRPVQLLVAGKAHPQDEAGQKQIQLWFRYIRQPALRSHVIFLEDYDLAMAAQLVQGVDVWINTPREPWEACGTSGMKVLVNGGLNLSVLDGWWAEAWKPDLGWAIASGSDAEQARRLMEILEDEVVPMFYRRDAAGIPCEWVARIRASLAQLAPRFSSNRMLKEYVERLYLPAAASLAIRAASGAQGARAFCAWAHHLRRSWDGLRLGSMRAVEAEGVRRFHVDAYLGELEPDDIEVQLYADAGPFHAESRCHRMACGQPIPGSLNGYVYAVELPVEGATSDYTPRIIPHREGLRLPQELALIRWL